MPNLSPKKTLERLNTIANALEQLAPEVAFGGLKANDFRAQVNKSVEKRNAIEDLEDQMTAAINDRELTDNESLLKAQLIVNGVVGNPEFGPDSALYEALGYVRKSDRRSGLTRKKLPATQPAK